jgi:membrane-associated protein
MELIAQFVDIVLHLDRHLQWLVANYGTWIYALLFLIVFCETGLVVTPFLPGDSLLFVTGAVAAAGGMDIQLTIILLTIAAILGDSVNYALGHYVGPRVFREESSRWLNRSHLERAREFYERHGGKTIIIARFIPIIRTYAPFVAGIGAMAYRRFVAYNVSGALLWVVSLCLAGYFFGNIPFVKSNLTVVIFAIIGLSLLPLAFEFLRHKLYSRAQ